jgi:hypothetical protein
MNRLTTVGLLACLLPLASCSSDDAGPVDEGTHTGAPVLGGGGMGDDFSEGNGGSGLAGGAADEPGRAGASGQGSCSPPDSDGACVGQTYAGESIPLDIYVMFDQSGSMCSCLDAAASQVCPNPDCSETRLDAVRDATSQFLNDPKSAGIGVGLGYFGKQAIGQASCAQSEYDAAAVGIGALPEHASAIMNSLNQVAPTGETPTGAAIRGACTYASAYKQNTPGHQVVILLLTDGKPEAPATCQGGDGPCCPSLSDAVTAAEECRTGAAIKTYVLGVGPLLDNLAQIAVAGGTERAYLVEGGDVSAQVLDALNRIRGDAAIPCQLQLPQPPNGQTLVYDQVNLEYESSECEPTLFYAVPGATDCGTDDGWYYDDSSHPQSIQLCPRSCDRVSGPGGALLFSVGCATQIRIR